MIKDLFEEVRRLDDSIQSNLIEVSVKQHQIDFMFKKDMLVYVSDLNDIKSSFEGLHLFEEPYLTVFEDEIHFIIPNIELNNMKQHIFMKFIGKLADEICTCPSLEFVISPFYIRCYLDKPGLFVDDLKKYDKILNDKGTLELHTQRPYLLYVYYGVHDDTGEKTRDEVN